MITLGLTGGIASGKSTVSRLLRQRGAAIVDADAIARQVVAPGSTGLAAVIGHFGDAYLTGDGGLDRPRLGRLVFADPAARRALEALLHPLIHREIDRQLGAAAAQQVAVAVLDAALLFEMGLDRACTATATVQADPAQQIARMAARDGLSRDEALQRLAAQASHAERAARATWVIDNRGTLADLEAGVDRLMAALQGLAVDAPGGGQRSNG